MGVDMAKYIGYGIGALFLMVALIIVSQSLPTVLGSEGLGAVLGLSNIGTYIGLKPILQVLPLLVIVAFIGWAFAKKAGKM